MRRAAAIVGLLLGACAGSGDDGASDVPPSTATSTTEAPVYPYAVEPVPSAGCGASAVGLVTRERRTVDVAGQERWYLLSTPPAHDGATPLPLVIEFHGLAEGAQLAAEFGRLDALGEREGFVSVFPQGTGEPVRWDVDPRQDNPDFAFVATLLDTLERDLCIDEARVYATGLSNGAMMSSAMACTESDRFAAIAPVAGVRRPDDCDPSRPVPVLAFHGTADPILLFNGGVGDLAAVMSGQTPSVPEAPPDLNGEGHPAAVRAWADGNGCSDATDEQRSAHVIERTYDCPVDAEVRFFIIEGGGHAWPGSAAMQGVEHIVGEVTDELDATAEAWRFFQRHARATRS